MTFDSLAAIDWLRGDLLPLIALALVPVIAGLWVMRRRLTALRTICERRHIGRLFPGLARRAGGSDPMSWLFWRSLLRVFLGAVATASLVFALFGPVVGFTLVPVQRRQIDVVLALDTSRSMLVEDVAPNRLDRAKVEIGALLDAMQGERFALVAFAGAARDVTPLTRDLDTARHFLDRLSPDDNRKGGTDIGAALRLALERFEDASGANEAVILVTDGEDLTAEGLAAAESAAERGVRVHVLGMGSEGGGKIPDGSGGFIIDREAVGGPAEVVSKLTSDSLRRIAESTGGIYLQAQGRVLPLEELYQRAIAPMEGRDIVDGKERVPRDRYQWPLAIALLALLIEGALRDTREAKHRREAVSETSEQRAEPNVDSATAAATSTETAA